MNKRTALAVLFLAVAFAGSLVLMNMRWTYQEQVVVKAEEASSRVAIEQANVTVHAFNPACAGTGREARYCAGDWISEMFPLRNGETVTLEFLEFTPKPELSTAYQSGFLGGGVSFNLIRGPPPLPSEHLPTVFQALYDSTGLSSPTECIVPETGEYYVILRSFEKREVSASFKLTVKSTEIIGGVTTVSRSVAPYEMAEPLLMLWLAWLGVGMLVGAACALLVRPKQVVQPPKNNER
jgi:hypothetical protein